MLHKAVNCKSIQGWSLSKPMYHLRIKKNISQYENIKNSSSESSLISPDYVLSKSNKERCVDRLKSLKTVDISQKKKIKKAAVLVPLCELNKNLAFLYTVRAVHLKINGGEVAFPGGMLDSTDENAENGALREAFEEVGIISKEVDIWGKGPEINRNLVSVTPVLGYIRNLNLDKLKINPSEVSVIFPVTLEHLSSFQNFRVTRFRLGKNLIYKTPVYLGATKRIWGLTAYITHLILISLIPEYYQKNIHFQPSTQRVLYSKKKL